MKGIVEIERDAVVGSKWFDIGVKSGTKNTVICVNEELELLRKHKMIRTKKQLIDHMQEFCQRLVKR